MKGVLAAACAAALAACDAPQLTGVAAGLDRAFETPRRPLADPATATFAFEPITGIPGNVADDLRRRLWRQAEEEGLEVVRRPGGRALFTIEGTLTAVSDDTNALMFYVFDVKDVNGRRLHRISGQQRSEDSDGDPWSAVATRDLDLIAQRLAALLRGWLYADA